MSDDKKRDQHRSHAAFLFWGTAALALPVFYVLSVGPATFLALRYPALQVPFETVYMPLQLGVDVLEGSGGWGDSILHPFYRYVSWWMS